MGVAAILNLKYISNLNHKREIIFMPN